MLYVLSAGVETACLSSRHPSGVLLSPVGTLDDKQAVERSGTPAKKAEAAPKMRASAIVIIICRAMPVPVTKQGLVLSDRANIAP